MELFGRSSATQRIDLSKLVIGCGVEGGSPMGSGPIAANLMVMKSPHPRR